MTQQTFEQCLVQADAAAQTGSWQEAIQALKQAETFDPNQTGVLTALGTCHIQLNRVEEAIAYFERVAELLPDVFEAHNNLGVAFTLAGKFDQAEKAYRRALEIDGENLSAWKNLAQACLQQETRVAEGVQILANMVKAHPEDAGALTMMANVYEDTGDLASAETLFRRALQNEPGNPEAGEGLTRIEAAQARQARIARPEHAQKLAALKGLKKPAAETAPDLPVVGPFLPTMKKLAFYAMENTPAYLQADLMARSLKATGRQVKLGTTFDPGDLSNQDLILFSQPNLSSDLINAIKQCIQMHQPYALDIDQDYLHLPEDHPGYSQVGPGNPASMNALEVMLHEAQFAVVHATVMAERYQYYCKKVEFVPPAVDVENRLWKKPRQKHPGFRVGWIGSVVDRDDLLSVKKALLAFMRAVPEAVLVFAGDEGASARFGAIDESRRMFLPAAGPDEIPYLLGQFDLLIVPMRDNLFNQAKSALPLMEACERGIPWIASPIPAFKEWGKGGVLAETQKEWEAALNQAVASVKR